jgi:hypothetical protein
MLEIDQHGRLLTRGRGGLHFENLEVIPRLARRLLAAAGLLERALAQARSPRLRRVRLACPRLPAALDGLRILHLSDLHIDGVAGLAVALEAMLPGVDADLCVLTGDYRFAVNGPADNVYPAMRRVVASIRAPLGVFGILGNHDFLESVPFLREAGIRMLVNEGAAVRWRGGALWLAGVDDPHFYGCDDLDAALEGRPRDGFTVLLAHSPEVHREAARRGVDVYLCGHTHAGQFRLPGVGHLWSNASCPRRMVSGAWRHRGMAGYTSAGTGASGVPARLFCPPEVALIELRRGSRSDAREA